MSVLKNAYHQNMFYLCFLLFFNSFILFAFFMVSFHNNYIKKAENCKNSIFIKLGRYFFLIKFNYFKYFILHDNVLRSNRVKNQFDPSMDSNRYY